MAARVVPPAGKGQGACQVLVGCLAGTSSPLKGVLLLSHSFASHPCSSQCQTRARRYPSCLGFHEACPRMSPVRPLDVLSNYPVRCLGPVQPTSSRRALQPREKPVLRVPACSPPAATSRGPSVGWPYPGGRCGRSDARIPQAQLRGAAVFQTC